MQALPVSDPARHPHPPNAVKTYYYIIRTLDTIGAESYQPYQMTAQRLGKRYESPTIINQMASAFDNGFGVPNHNITGHGYSMHPIRLINQ